jgi:hypothetical protein
MVSKCIALCVLICCLMSPVVSSDSEGSCMVCDENMFCTNEGVNPCPAKSNSSFGSSLITDCKCAIGHSGVDGGTCTECVLGSYKDVTGNSSCLFCANNTYSDTTASSSCTDCPENTSSNEIGGGKGISDCVCDEGFTRVDSICIACGAGTYKTWIGDDACLECGVGTYSPSIAATDPESCLSCPADSVSSTGSKTIGDCECAIGHERGSGVGCVACAMGSYKTDVGTGGCTICPQDTYADVQGASNCSSCPASTTAGSGTESVVGCSCIPGYERTDDSTCQACAPNEYSRDPGPNSCVPCPAAHMSSPAASSGPEDCVCLEGYSGNHLIGCTLDTVSTTTSTTTTTTSTTTTTTSTTTSSTPAPAIYVPPQPNSAISFFVSVELDVAGVTNQIQTTYIQGLSDLLGIDAAIISIKSVTELTHSHGRRLLTPQSAVATVITVPNDTVDSTIAGITYENIEPALSVLGIPVIAVSPPTVVQVNPTQRRPLAAAELRLLSMMGSCPCVV